MSALPYDHTVLFTHDLDAAGDRWRKLGFQTTTRMYHPAEMGTMNELIMLQDNYIELLAVAEPTDIALRYQSLAGGRDGAIMHGLRSSDIDEDLGHIRSRGGLVESSDKTTRREVPLPSGRKGTVAYRAWGAPNASFPRCMLFACCHLHPEHLWVLEWQQHPNTARRLRSAIFVSKEPLAHEDYFEKVLGIGCIRMSELGIHAQLGSGEEVSCLEILSEQVFTDKYPGLRACGHQDAGDSCVGLRIEVESLDTTRAILEQNSVAMRLASDTRIQVADDAGTGVFFEFVPQRID